MNTINGSGDDDAAEGTIDEFINDSELLYDRVAEFMDANDLDDAYAVELLLDIALRLRLSAYGLGVDKPSVMGLKLDLDRWKTDIDSMIRDAKKGAEDYIDHFKKVRAAIDEAAIDDEESKPS
jgi:hypothetical protein